MVGNTAVNDSKGVLLHFQAKQIREAALGDLVATHRLAHVSVVIISGGSAGGLAAFLHADWWCDSLAEKSAGFLHKCVALADSGFFLDYESPRAAAGPPPPSYHAGYYRSILALPPSTPQSVTRFGTSLETFLGPMPTSSQRVCTCAVKLWLGKAGWYSFVT